MRQTQEHSDSTGMVTGPYLSLLSLTGRAFMGLTGVFFAFDDGLTILTNERTLRLIGLLSQPKSKR